MNIFMRSWPSSFYNCTHFYITHLHISGNPIHVYARHQPHKNVQPHFWSPISVAMTPTRAKWVLWNRLSWDHRCWLASEMGGPCFICGQIINVLPCHLSTSLPQQSSNRARQGFVPSHGWLTALEACCTVSETPENIYLLLILQCIMHFKLGNLLVFFHGWNQPNRWINGAESSNKSDHGIKAQTVWVSEVITSLIMLYRGSLMSTSRMWDVHHVNAVM